MTRDSDIDPVSAANLAAMHADGKPNPDDRAYLQTRCDVANSVNARMFISIHVNYSDSPSVSGTTFYWYKPEDQLLAQTLEHAVIPAAGTNDVGPRHENFYVIRHTTMPAVLIETAFISNPHDAALLAHAGIFAEHGARHRQRRQGVRRRAAGAGIASRSVIGVYDSGLGGLTVLAALARGRRSTTTSCTSPIKRTCRTANAPTPTCYGLLTANLGWLGGARRRSGRHGLQHVVRGREPAGLAAGRALRACRCKISSSTARGRLPATAYRGASRSSRRPPPCAATPTRARSRRSRRPSRWSRSPRRALVPLVEAGESESERARAAVRDVVRRVSARSRCDRVRLHALPAARRALRRRAVPGAVRDRSGARASPRRARARPAARRTARRSTSPTATSCASSATCAAGRRPNGRVTGLAALPS